MPESSTIRLDKLLDHPAVMDAIADVNMELKERIAYQPPVCNVFKRPLTSLATDPQYRFEIDRQAHRQLAHIIDNTVQRVEGRDAVDDEEEKKYRQARNIGIVFSGGPAPGGHNVIAGLFDAAQKANPQTKLYGFLMGPDGIIDGDYQELTRERVDPYRNVGGFTMIKTGRTKIDNRRKMDLSRETCKKLSLDALVVVGGDDSNTNAAFLAEEMFADSVQVIGVPKTIDGDIQVRDARGKVLCAMSFGFHTAARAFSQAIANLCTGREVLARMQSHGPCGQPPGPGGGPSDPRQHDPDR